MALNNLPQREEYLRKKRNKKLFKYGLIIFLIIFIVGFSSYASHRPQIRISKIQLSGGVLVTQDDVESEVRPLISGSYFWLYPKNNAFLYPKKLLENHLKDKFQRIDTINIHLKGFNTMVIDITERKPVAMWCDVLPNSTISVGQGTTTITTMADNNCYFIDQNSTIFAKAPSFSGDAYFKYYGLVSIDEPIGKQYIASSTEFSEISDFVTKVKSLSIQPLYLIGKDEGEFSLVISGGGQIYFDIKEPLSLVASNLEALLRTQALATTTSGNLPIDYIDLRYGDKLFYKLK